MDGPGREGGGGGGQGGGGGKEGRDFPANLDHRGFSCIGHDTRAMVSILEGILAISSVGMEKPEHVPTLSGGFRV